eukprot:scaffold45727_cov72-Phaeocystis_antarctica.AAC.1
MQPGASRSWFNTPWREHSQTTRRRTRQPQARRPARPALLRAHAGDCSHRHPTTGTLHDAMLSFTGAASLSFAASGACPPAQFHTLGSSFNLTEYTRATWYIQKQQVTGYQNLSDLFCVTATYALEGKTVPLSNDTVATVYNYGNEGRVNGPNQNADNMTLCARAVDPDDPSKLAVAPCFLPNSLAGPCTPARFEPGCKLTANAEPAQHATASTRQARN